MPLPSPDVVVIGGSPAGLTAATLLAQKGYKVRLFERDRTPRLRPPNLLRAAAEPTLQRLGIIDKLESVPVPKQFVVQAINPQGEMHTLHSFDVNPDGKRRYWPIQRGLFDELLIENAKAYGVEIHRGVHVMDVLFESEQATGIGAIDTDGGYDEVEAKVVLDAGGKDSLIRKRVHKAKGHKVPGPREVIWSYFDARPPVEPGAGLVVYEKPTAQEWFWCAPLTPNVSCVGLVTWPRSLTIDLRTLDAFFQQKLAEWPALHNILGDGRSLVPLQLHDTTWSVDEVSGSNWALLKQVADGGFPVGKFDLTASLRCAELAANAVADGLARNDLGPKALNWWTARLCQELGLSIPPPLSQTKTHSPAVVLADCNPYR